jgi:hypothetical protein
MAALLQRSLVNQILLLLHLHGIVELIKKQPILSKCP